MFRNRKNINEDHDDLVDDQAMEWLLKFDDGLDADQKLAFDRWLNERDDHRVAYEKKLELWGRFTSLSFKDYERLSELSESDRKTFRENREFASRISIMGAAAILALSVLGVTLWTHNNSSDHYYLPNSTYASSGTQMHVLEDGSTIELNKGTQLEVRYTEKSRTIDLITGEAFFAVAKDPLRPFRVLVSNTSVTAIGTAFNVKLDDRAIEVIVTEGEVGVDQKIPANDTDGFSSKSIRIQTLNTGHIMTFSLDSPPASSHKISQDDLEQSLAWSHRRLVFRDTPLADVISTFNKYNVAQVVAEDHDILELKVNATFRSNSLDSLLRLLELSLPIAVQKRDDNSMVILSKGDV